MSEQPVISDPESCPEDRHSIAAREPVRNQLSADVEAFLKQGGSIQVVPQDYRADPPKAPQSNYGRGSL